MRFLHYQINEPSNWAYHQEIQPKIEHRGNYMKFPFPTKRTVFKKYY